jgi:hypothetical protein
LSGAPEFCIVPAKREGGAPHVFEPGTDAVFRKIGLAA